MNKIRTEVLFKNILIHTEIEKISKLTESCGIKLILLKGAALIELFPEYSFTREMEDIDVLINKSDYSKFINILKTLGYVQSEEDPNVMYNATLDIKIDIKTDLWYMTRKEKAKLFNCLLKIKNFYILPPGEMLRYIIMHSYISHNSLEKKWQQDIKLIKERLNEKFDFKIPAIVFRFLKKNVFYKGHFLPIFILPFPRNLTYLFEKILPSVDFIKRRYNIQRNILIPFFYIYRLTYIIAQSARIIINLITLQINRLFLNSN